MSSISSVLDQLKAVLSSDGSAINVADVAGNIINVQYDYLENTYITSGNGAGQIGTITYKKGGANGTVMAVVTLTYDSTGNLISMARV